MSNTTEANNSTELYGEHDSNSASNMTGANNNSSMDQVDKHNFREFPESKWQSLVPIVVPIALIGVILFGYLHYNNDPYLISQPISVFRRRVTNVIIMVILYYVVPAINS